jgi:hypothetical protein
LSTLHVPDDPRKSADVASPAVALDDRPHDVYRLYDATDALLYVGCTVDIAARVYALATGKRWIAETTRLTVQHFPDRATALTAEAAAIDAEGPRCNGTHSPVYGDLGDLTTEERKARRRAFGAEKPRTIQRRLLGSMTTHDGSAAITGGVR